MKPEEIIKECQFKATRSSGAGGQHVNKVATKVEVAFHIEQSKGLSETEKSRLLAKLQHRITKDGFLIIQCSETRSQHKNKDLVIKRLLSVLRKGLEVSKKRKPTKPTRASVLKRLKHKNIRKNIKQNRKKHDLE